MHNSAYADAERFVANYLSADLSYFVADIGSADINGSLKPLFANEKWIYKGYDVSPGKNVDIVLSEFYHWPEIESNSCDVVVSSQVVEHVKHPWRWIKEIERIVKPDGLVYICTPNTIEYHPYPIDCWRLWPDGMRGLLDETDLVPIEVYSIGMDTTGIARKGNGN